MIGMLVSSLILVLFGFFIPSLLVFGNAEIFNPEIGLKYLYYPHFLVYGIAVCIGLWFLLRLWGKNNQLGDGMGFYSIGEKPSAKIFKNFSPFQLYLLSLIFFSFIFLIINGLGGGAGTEVRFLPQQFTKTDNIVFSLLFIVISENILILAISSIILLLFQFFLVRFNLDSAEYIFWNYVVFAGTHGVIAWILHQTVYAGSQIGGIVVFFFWVVVGILNLATGVPYPGIAFHQNNNLPLLMAIIFSVGSYFTVVIGVIISCVVLYLLLYGKSLWGQKKQPSEIIG